MVVTLVTQRPDQATPGQRGYADQHAIQHLVRYTTVGYMMWVSTLVTSRVMCDVVTNDTHKSVKDSH